MSDSMEWIERRIHDKRHFTARYLAHLSDLSGMNPGTIAKIFCGVLFVILTFCDQAHFFANSILIGVPLLLIFCYPDEKPTEESFYIYFPAFGAITLFDRNLESIPFYYALKLALFLLFFMPPYNLNRRICDLLNKDPEIEITQKSRSSQKKSAATATETSTRTAIQSRLTSGKSNVATDVTQMTATPSPMPVTSVPKSSDVKVTVIEEYYREEELLSPNGTTVIQRVVTGPFRKETSRTEKRKDK